MTHNSSVNFKLILFLLWIRESYQCPNFETSECSGENFPNFSCHFWKQKSVFHQNLHQYSVLSNINPLYFLAETFYSLVKGSPLKWNFWDFWVFMSKFVKFPKSLASLFIVMTHNSPVNFKFIHFLLWIKEPHQSPNFEPFECCGENFPNPLYHFWKHKSVFHQISHQYSVPSNINPLYFFSPNIIKFGQKQPIKVQIFEIFQCLGRIC